MAARKSRLARVIHSRTSSVAASSIKFTALSENLVKKRGAQVFVTIDLGSGGNQNVLGKAHTAKASVRALHAFDTAFPALAHDDHQIDITIPRWGSPRRASQKAKSPRAQTQSSTAQPRFPTSQAGLFSRWEHNLGGSALESRSFLPSSRQNFPGGRFARPCGRATAILIMEQVRRPVERTQRKRPEELQ